MSVSTPKSFVLSVAARIFQDLHINGRCMKANDIIYCALKLFYFYSFFSYKKKILLRILKITTSRHLHYPPHTIYSSISNCEGKVKYPSENVSKGVWIGCVIELSLYFDGSIRSLNYLTFNILLRRLLFAVLFNCCHLSGFYCICRIKNTYGCKLRFSYVHKNYVYDLYTIQKSSLTSNVLFLSQFLYIRHVFIIIIKFYVPIWNSS